MVRITVDLIRKKSEHHSGPFAEMEELTLHQLRIERIEVLSRVCPRLKILYLQTNYIPKIEGLTRLKNLEYLSLAINNITAIEGLQNCEKLRKLDLTLNFVDVDALAAGVAHLRDACPALEDLTLTGNPLDRWADARAYICAHLPALLKLDGTDVTRSERLKAQARLPQLELDLQALADARRKERAAETKAVGRPLPADADATDAAAAAAAADSKSAPAAASAAANGTGAAAAAGAAGAADSKTAAATAEAAAAAKTSAYTPESRLEVLREQEAADREKERKEAEERARTKLERDPWGASLERLNARVVWRDGDPIPSQRNPSKLEFAVTETHDGGGACGGGVVVVDIAAPKYVDTSLMLVDAHPKWFQVLVKDKLLLLHTPADISPAHATVQRVPHNGYLRITLPKLKAAAGAGAAAGADAKGAAAAGAVAAADAIDLTGLKSKAAAAKASAAGGAIAAGSLRSIVPKGAGASAAAAAPAAFGGLSQVNVRRNVKRLKDDAQRQAERDAEARKQAEADRALAAYRAKKQLAAAPAAAAATAAPAAAAASAGGDGAADDDDGPPPLESVH